MLALIYSDDLRGLFVAELDADGRAVARSRMLASADFNEVGFFDHVEPLLADRIRLRAEDLAPLRPGFCWSARSIDVIAELGEPGPTATVDVATEADMRGLSYFTLCRLADATRLADPVRGLPAFIQAGRFRGRLTTDRLGNFVAFE